MKRRHLFFKCFLLFSLFSGLLGASEILVNTLDGEMFVFEIDPKTTVQELQDHIAVLSQNRHPFLIEIPADENFLGFSAEASRNQGGYLGYPRAYYKDITSEEKNDIRFIVNSLANKSLISLAVYKSDLEAAGDRIDHIHPLRFLMTIFSDEELKVGVRNIRGRGWIWNHFISGLKESLSTETNIDNMKTDFIEHFSQTLKINSSTLVPLIWRQDWDHFIDTLITSIPRTGDHDRYDM
jgi:hypothetical protein